MQRKGREGVKSTVGLGGMNVASQIRHIGAAIGYGEQSFILPERLW
jgi:hypothetical protein